jgi:hypothetical protein
VCVYVCMYVCMYVCLLVCGQWNVIVKDSATLLCRSMMEVCVCVRVCMYVCMYLLACFFID